MNIFITLAILLVNIVAITLIYQFVKKLQKMDKLIFIVASFAITYILVSIIYWISGFGIDSRINDVAKEFITYIFVPVNIILLVPFIAIKYRKFKLKEIDASKLLKTFIIVGIITIIILTIECIYFKNIKENIKILNNDIKQNLQGSDQNKANANVMSSEIENDISVTNTILTNTENTITNEVTNNVTNT